MGNESSVFKNESSQPYNFESADSKAGISCDTSILALELPAKTFEDFPNLDLLLAQPLVIGKKRLRTAISAPEEIFIEDIAKEVLVKRVCINL
jgi:hypothetical protein